MGYTDAEPYNAIADQVWVTDAPGGFPSDYLAVSAAPILIIDPGADLVLAEMSTWGYASSNSNGARDFKLRFATAAEGTSAFGAPSATVRFLSRISQISPGTAMSSARLSPRVMWK